MSADSTPEKVPVVNLPNALTTLRLILVPVFLWLLLVDTTAARWGATAVFCVAAYTDHLDGKIARARNLITDFGKIVDPIADKALTLGGFIVLCLTLTQSFAIIPWWFTALIVIRELGITAWRAVLLRKGVVVPASKGGKLKTVLQMAFLIGLLIPWASFVSGTLLTVIMVIYWIIGAAALAVTVWSGLDYVMAGMKAEKAS